MKVVILTVLCLVPLFFSVDAVSYEQTKSEYNLKDLVFNDIFYKAKNGFNNYMKSLRENLTVRAIANPVEYTEEKMQSRLEMLDDIQIMMMLLFNKVERQLVGLSGNYISPSSQENIEGLTQTSFPSSTERSTTESESASSTSASQPSSTAEFETHEDDSSFMSGSIRGLPGVHFPNYTDIPITSFSCSSMEYIPGFYADLETGCQVFHVCWPHRRESFLCPIGTTFNQAVLACDFWYSSNCSLASYYYNINAQTQIGNNGKISGTVSMVDVLLGKDGKQDSPPDLSQVKKADISYILKFLPVKAKVVVFPETANTRSKIVATASIGKGKKTQIRKVTEKSPAEVLEPEFIPVKVDHKTSKELNRKAALTSAFNKETYARHGLSSAVSIVQEVLDLVGNVLRETAGIYSSINTAKQSEASKDREPASPTQHRPLTKLNPRFITKAIEVPKANIGKEKPRVARNKGQAPSTPVSPSRIQVNKSAKASKMVHSTSKTSELNVSTSTKSMLVKNYLKLLNMRKL